MAEQNPLLAQFMGGRQTGQATPFQVSQGQGMAPGQVAAYLQGNALTVPNRIDGKANQMIDSDPAADLRARERFQEKVDLQVYGDQQAMKRQEKQLEGQKAIAESNNALTKELTYARLDSAKELLDKELAFKAKTFESKQEWDTYALEAGISQQEADRIWKSKESKLDRDAKAASEDKNIEARKELFNLESTLKTALQDKALASQEAIASMQNEISKQRNELMGRELDIKENLGLEELAQRKDEFGQKIQLEAEKLQADIDKADMDDKRLLKIAQMQLEGQKYNVDKSFELKMLERQDDANRAQYMQGPINEMIDRVTEWKASGSRSFQEESEASFILSNSLYIKGVDDIRSIYKPNGNIDLNALNKVKEQLYSNPENEALLNRMNSFVTSSVQAMNTSMQELEKMAFKYKGLYSPTVPATSTQPQTAPQTAPNAINAPQQFTPTLPPGFSP